MTIQVTEGVTIRQQFVDALVRLGAQEADFPNLIRSYEASQTVISNARSHLLASDLDPQVDVIGFGSLGRYEMSNESDLDYVIVRHGPSNQGETWTVDLVDGLRSVVVPGREIRAPGSTGLFGAIIDAGDLYEVIGLEADTNRTHSRRSLVLEESVSLCRPNLHKELLHKMVKRYVDAIPLGSSCVPRFLVNDLARYWRQLAVDYQAKSESGAPSSLRRLKLIGPRKFTYASSVLPLLTLDLRGLDKDQLVDTIVDTFLLPPSLRFLREVEYLVSTGASVDTAGQALRAVRAVDAFNGLLSDGEWRLLIGKEQSREEAEKLKEFAEARELARELQAALDEIFFSPKLEALTRKYLVF
ncbi:hypothetical protein [Agreia sp. Leaf244]|uniref:hypothetical protein n=1 Tax=Agreia sp. Leaf244 TaxID=1736305 RepID=UPI000A402CE9|nr:hypothetical protein [Agreia sp. Leaf244]